MAGERDRSTGVGDRAGGPARFGSWRRERACRECRQITHENRNVCDRCGAFTSPCAVEYVTESYSQKVLGLFWWTSKRTEPKSLRFYGSDEIHPVEAKS